MNPVFPASLVALVLASGCASVTHLGDPELSSAPPATAARESFEVRREIPYTPENWPLRQIGDLYLPDSPSPGPRPGVLLLHGGGWAAPERRDEMNGIARTLASHGYVVFNVTYRLTPLWQYPAPVDDLREAIRWLRRNADSLALDPDRIAAFGYSAGGHLAAMLGLMDGPRETRIQAVVAGGAPADMPLFDEGAVPVTLFLGGTREQVPEVYREASPITYIDRGDPPVFLYHASRDLIVSPEHARRFYAALGRAGVPRELYWMNGRHHVSGFLLDAGAVDTAAGFLNRVFGWREGGE